MNANELRKLNRKELLELLLVQTENNENLKAEIVNLRHKQSCSSQANISDLSEKIKEINDIFRKCEAVSRGYIAAVNMLKATGCVQSENLGNKQAQLMIKEAEAYSAKIRNEADEYSRRVREEADAYKNSTKNLIETFLEDYFNGAALKGIKQRNEEK